MAAIAATLPVWLGACPLYVLDAGLIVLGSVFPEGTRPRFGELPCGAVIAACGVAPAATWGIGVNPPAGVMMACPGMGNAVAAKAPGWLGTLAEEAEIPSAAVRASAISFAL